MVLLDDSVLLEIKRGLVKQTKSQVKRLSSASAPRKSELSIGASKIPKLGARRAYKQSPPGRHLTGEKALASVKASPPVKKRPYLESPKLHDVMKSSRRKSVRQSQREHQITVVEDMLSPSPVSKKQRNSPSPKSDRPAVNTQKAANKSPISRKQKDLATKSDNSPSRVYYLRSGRGTPPSSEISSSAVKKSSRKDAKMLLKTVENESALPTRKTAAVDSGMTAEVETSAVIMTKIRSRRRSETRASADISEMETPLKPNKRQKLSQEVENGELLPPSKKKKTVLTNVHVEQKWGSRKDIVEVPVTPVPLYNGDPDKAFTSSVGRPRKGGAVLKPLSVENVISAASSAAVTSTSENHSTINHTTVVHVLESNMSNQENLGQGRFSVNWDTSDVKNRLLDSIPRATRSQKLTDSNCDSILLNSISLPTASQVTDKPVVGTTVSETTGIPVETMQEVESDVKPSGRPNACARFGQFVLLLGLPAAIAFGTVAYNSGVL
jgi:hypothetical protein